MKPFNLLTNKQQKQAIQYEINNFINNFDLETFLYDKELTEVAHNIIRDCDEKQTPWFIEEALMKNEQVAAQITEIAKDFALATLYADDDEHIIYISNLKKIKV